MSIKDIIDEVRGDIYVERRGRHSFRAVHCGVGWEEAYGRHSLAQRRVRYWRILAVAARAGYDWLAFDQEAHDFIDEGGAWDRVARRLVGHLRKRR
jgi:hypothetical protein